jgi:hypothetical protein
MLQYRQSASIMTTSTPQWLQTVEKKRALRDQAISNFLDGSAIAHQVP